MDNYSVSQINTFNECKGKHELQYVEGIQPIVTESRNLNIGSAVHAGLAGAMRGFHRANAEGYDPQMWDEVASTEAHKALKSWAADNLPDETTFIFDPIEGIAAVAGDFMEQWQDDFELAEQLVFRTIHQLDFVNNWRVVTVADAPAVEIEVSARLPHGQFFRGFVDVVLRDVVTDLIHVVDWKTKSIFTDAVDFEFDSQLPMYLWALWNIGISASYVLMYQIKKTLPRVPSVNKNGQMSKTNITTDWLTYENAVVANAHNDPLLKDFLKRDYTEDELRHYIRSDAYADMVDKLIEYEFFRPLRRAIPLSVAEVYRDNFQRTVNLIEKSDDKPFVWNSFVCRGCAYRAFCSALVQGSDPNTLIGTIYTRRDNEQT